MKCEPAAWSVGLGRRMLLFLSRRGGSRVPRLPLLFPLCYCSVLIHCPLARPWRHQSLPQSRAPREQLFQSPPSHVSSWPGRVRAPLAPSVPLSRSRRAGQLPPSRDPLRSPPGFGPLVRLRPCAPAPSASLSRFRRAGQPLLSRAPFWPLRLGIVVPSALLQYPYRSRLSSRLRASSLVSGPGHVALAS